MGIREFSRLYAKYQIEAGVNTYAKAIVDIKTRMDGEYLKECIDAFEVLQDCNCPIQDAFELICEATLRMLEIPSDATLEEIARTVDAFQKEE